MNGSGGFEAMGGLGMGSRVYISNPAALGVLLVGLCTGIISLLVLLTGVFLRCFPRRQLTVFMVSLVFTSLLHVISSSVVLAELLGSLCWLDNCDLLYDVWYSSRQCGVLLHLLVALEFFCGKTLLGPKLLRLYLTLPVVLLVNLLCLLFCRVLIAAVFLGALASNLWCLLLVLALFSYQGEKILKVKVVLTALLTFGGTYFPSFLLECMLVSNVGVSQTLYVTFLCLTNLRVLMDGYLCWIICRQSPQPAPQQGLEAGHLNLDPVSQVSD